MTTSLPAILFPSRSKTVSADAFLQNTSHLAQANNAGIYYATQNKVENNVPDRVPGGSDKHK